MSVDPTSIREKLEAFIARYGPAAGADGSERYFTEVLGVTLDDWQRDVARAVGDEHRQIAIASCHGPGKTFVAAGCITRWLATHFPLKVAITAPTKGQLEDALMAEVVQMMDTHWPKWLRNLFEVTSDRIEFIPRPKESFATFRTARDENPEALQGVHQDKGWVKLIADEASGVGDRVFEAAGGSMSGERCQFLLLSNPTRRKGYFYDTFHSLRDQWTLFNVAFSDSSRVSREWVESIRVRYGEHSNTFRVRCLGQFPMGDEDSVVDYALLCAARGRDVTPLPGTVNVWGLDVATTGRDRSVLMKRKDKVLLPDLRIWRQKEVLELVSLVVQEYRATPTAEQPGEILVDSIGVGSGVASMLQTFGLPARSVNVSEQAAAQKEFLNKRAELWWMVREWVQSRECALPSTPVYVNGEGTVDQITVLINELSTPFWYPTPTGKVQIESTKEVVKKLRGDSPDLASAFVLTFAGMYGSGADVRGTKATGESLRRFRTGRAGWMR